MCLPSAISLAEDGGGLTSAARRLVPLPSRKNATMIDENSIFILALLCHIMRRGRRVSMKPSCYRNNLCHQDALDFCGRYKDNRNLIAPMGFIRAISRRALSAAPELQ